MTALMHHEEKHAAKQTLRSDPEPEEEAKGSPNDKVRAVTGQPSQQAAPVPLSQVLTPNQVVATNRSHAGRGPNDHD